MSSTSSLKNLQKTRKCTLRTFVFDLKVASKPFFKKLSMTRFGFKQFLMFCLTFPGNGCNFVNQNIAKNLKSAIFKRPQYWFLSSKKVKNHFLRKFLWPNFVFNCFRCFASLSQKMASTSSPKNCKKLKISIFKCSENSCLISRSLQNHVLKSFLSPTLNLDGLEGCHAFPENGFNLLTQNFAKNLNMPFSNAQNICFWVQSSLKTIF